MNSAAARCAGCVLLAATLCTTPGLAQSTEKEEERPGAIGQALADEHVSAWLRLDYFRSSNSLDDQRDLVGGTLQIKALPHLNESLEAKIEGRLTAPDIRGRPGYGPKSELLEGYLTIHFSQADLRIGKQIVAWGRADGINPTDNLTPRNYRVLLPLEEDQRFGTTSARLDAYLSQTHTLTVFVSPYFEPDRFPLPTAGLAVVTRKPSHTLSSTEGGIRLNKVGGDFDWSLSYYHGYNLIPTAGSTGSALELFYNMMDVFGADCARNFGRFGFRTELAYTLPHDHSDVDPNATRPRLFWVAGVDRTFLEQLNVNLQGFVRWMPRYEDPARLLDPTARNVGALNSTIGGQESRVSTGMTFRVSNLWWNDTLRAEILAITNFKRGDWYLRPLVSYDMSDHLRLSFGGNLYRGARAGQFGVLRPNSGVFAELRYGL